MVVHKNWHIFMDKFFLAYRPYHIYKKATATDHGYGVSANHVQEIDAQMITADSLQSLANS